MRKSRVPGGIDPDGKELGAEISRADLLQIHVSFGDRRDRREIEALVEKSLRRIGMSVNHQRGSMDFAWVWTGVSGRGRSGPESCGNDEHCPRKHARSIALQAQGDHVSP